MTDKGLMAFNGGSETNYAGFGLRSLTTKSTPSSLLGQIVIAEGLRFIFFSSSHLNISTGALGSTLTELFPNLA